MKHKKKLLSVKLLAIATFSLVSCNSDGPEIEQPEKVYYDLAQKRLLQAMQQPFKKFC